jgi:tetratricopeptide (TPR) repeat protein
MGEWKLRILHISDLHERGPRERESFRRRRVLGNEWERNLDELLKDGPIDLVCFTGDVANFGKPEEYGPVTDFIGALLGKLALPMERLFLVPGNHDIDRDQGKSAWSKLRGKKGLLSRLDPLDLSRWMAGGNNPPLGLEKVKREELLSRQNSYREWVATKLGRKEIVPFEKAPHPFLGYRQTLRLPGHPFDIHVVGLDSAWLAGDDHDRGNLLLTTDQVGRLTTDKGEPLSGFRLALIHHPLSDLADKGDCQRLLADNVDLLLRGHLHEEDVETWADPDRTSRQLAAGCLYEGHRADQWPNACHVIEARLDDAGRPVRYDLRFRSWSKRGYWHDDNALYKGTENGRLTWWLGPRPIPPQPMPTGSFVGRAQELEALRAALLPAERRPVLICAVHGMPGVGKSYLAERFVELHRESFPGGCARLVLNPATLPSVEVLLGELGEQLGIPAGGRMAERCRERLLRPLSLLLLENVDSREAAGVAGRLVTTLPGCPIIVTGRYQGFWDEGGWKRIEVETFDEKTALHLLEQELRPPTDEREREDYGRLVRALGRLPLALHLAVGYLRAGHSVESFLTKLRESHFELEPVSPVDPLLMKDKARAIIRGTFELSMELLRRQLGTGAKAERLLAGLAALGQAPLSGFGRELGAAIAGVSELEFGELVSSASLLSLLSRVPGAERTDDAWRVHPLLAELLRESSESAAGLARMTEWFIEKLQALPVGQEQLQGERWKELHRESAALVDWLPRVSEGDRVWVVRAGSSFAIHNGPFRVWMDFCEQALNASLTPEERSNILWTLANVAMRCGAPERALSAAQEMRTLDQGRQAEHGSALAAGVCAYILQARGELDEALRIRREEELPVYERLGEVRSRAVPIGHVADILQARGELDEALRIRREEELPVYERLGDVRSRAVTMGNVADILQARGELDEALRILREEVLPAFERLGDVRSRAVTMGKVADILQERGELDEALRIRREEELPVYERLGDVRSRAVTMGKVADILQERGELDEALRIRREEQLPVYERLGDVRSRAVTMGNVAGILQERGELDEALRILREEVLPAFEWLGDVRSRAVTMGKVADILQERDELDEALRILREEQLPVYERLGDVRGLLVYRANLAVLYLRRSQPGDREMAASLLRMARTSAESLRLPEAAQILAIQRKWGL